MSDKVSRNVENLNRSGRKKGVPNKLTKSVREALEKTFQTMQDDPAVSLEAWGRANPTEFYKLASKLIPREVNAKVAGPDLAELLRS